ncbi:hypothetical protein F5B21DRAFT_473529 [Xylaria acuta]|nr:hypothetical protein F5B21DRAFT_473529 [Xylaria acuta]
MQFTTIVLSLFAALAVAITNDELAARVPACAKGCLEDGYKAVGCGLTDYPCQCNHQHGIFQISTSCINAKCTTFKEQEQMAAATTILCEVIAQQADPNWKDGPSVADLPLPPGLSF